MILLEIPLLVYTCNVLYVCYIRGERSHLITRFKYLKRVGRTSTASHRKKVSIYKYHGRYLRIHVPVVQVQCEFLQQL